MARKGILPRRKRGRASSVMIMDGGGVGGGSNNCDRPQQRHLQLRQQQLHSRSSSPSEPPFHFANYKLPDMRAAITKIL